MFYADMQRGIGAHRVADDVGSFYAERVNQRDNVGSSNVLTVTSRIVGNIRRRIAALAERDAAMGARKAAHLRLPGAIVACELMNEDDGRASARFFVMETYAVAGSDLRHCRVSTSWLRSDYNASQNAQAAPNAPG
jgi:hypothetical protein